MPASGVKGGGVLSLWAEKLPTEEVKPCPPLPHCHHGNRVPSQFPLSLQWGWGGVGGRGVTSWPPGGRWAPESETELMENSLDALPSCSLWVEIPIWNRRWGPDVAPPPQNPANPHLCSAVTRSCPLSTPSWPVIGWAATRAQTPGICGRDTWVTDRWERDEARAAFPPREPRTRHVGPRPARAPQMHTSAASRLWGHVGLWMRRVTYLQLLSLP